MGYFRGVIHGTLIGTAVGLCVAPQEGSRTRAQAKAAYAQACSSLQRAQETARSVAPRAQSAVRTVAQAAETVRGGVERIRHQQEQAEPYVSVNGSGNGSATVRD